MFSLYETKSEDSLDNTKSEEGEITFEFYQPTVSNSAARLESESYSTGPVFLNPPPDYSSTDTPSFRLQSAVDTAISMIPDETEQREYTLIKSGTFMGSKYPTGYARYSTTHTTSCFFAHVDADEYALMWHFNVSAYLREREVNNYAGETLTVSVEPGEATFRQLTQDQMPLDLEWSIARLGQIGSKRQISNWKARERLFTTQPSIASQSFRYPDESDVLVTLDLTLQFWRPYDEPETTQECFSQAWPSQRSFNQAGPSRENVHRRDEHRGLVRFESQLLRGG